MPWPGLAFVLDMLIVHDEREAQAAVAPLERTRTVIGHTEYFECAPVAEPGGVRHRLSQFGLSVRMLDEVDLVDDIDQVLRFGDAPEQLVDAQAQLPTALADFAEQQQVRFVHIEVGAARVGIVVAKEGRKSEASAVDIFQV